MFVIKQNSISLLLDFLWDSAMVVIIYIHVCAMAIVPGYNRTFFRNDQHPLRYFITRHSIVSYWPVISFFQLTVSQMYSLFSSGSWSSLPLFSFHSPCHDISRIFKRIDLGCSFKRIWFMYLLYLSITFS